MQIISIYIQRTIEQTTHANEQTNKHNSTRIYTPADLGVNLVINLVNHSKPCTIPDTSYEEVYEERIMSTLKKS